MTTTIADRAISSVMSPLRASYLEQTIGRGSAEFNRTRYRELRAELEGKGEDPIATSRAGKLVIALKEAGRLTGR